MFNGWEVVVGQVLEVRAALLHSFAMRGGISTPSVYADLVTVAASAATACR